MKLKIALIGILLASSSAFGAVTPVRDVDGTKQFAISTVAGFIAFTAAEQTYLQTLYGGPTVTLTPTSFEIALSTTITDITPDQFRLLIISKPDIVDKVMLLEEQLAAIEHFVARYPAFSVASTNKQNKIKAQVSMLVSLYLSL